MPPQAMNKIIARCAIAMGGILLFKWTLLDPKTTLPPGEIAHSGLLERISYGVSLSGQSLDPRRHPFLQSRLGRRDTIPFEDENDEAQAAIILASHKNSKNGALDSSGGSPSIDADGNPIYTEREKSDLFDTHISQGLRDFWNRFQLPFATNAETMHLDEQVVKGVVDELMAFNGWAAAACSSLTRPFAADRKDDNYIDLINDGQMYYFALVVHSADHFLIDQMATIIQLSKKLGPSNIFVSLLDYASTDSTPFLCDMADMVFTLLGISFRIKRIPPMTRDPAAAYYPLEESYTRNLVLEPLMELYNRRHVKFAKVIWLKGFTCPNDILETLRVSQLNKAAMTCSMDWKEHNGFFIFNDRWRTRDMDGNLFRGSKSTSPIDEAPPRDAASIKRYAQHLPFQVFCCESGVHIIDPSQSFYHGITYRSSIEHGIFNISAAEDGKAPKWSEGPCMDSAQMHFCRDLWMLSAREGVKIDGKKAHDKERKGLNRGLSDEMERIVKVIAPQYAPKEKNSGGYFGFGRKAPAVEKTKESISDDWDNEDEDDEEDFGDGVVNDASGSSDAAGAAGGDKKGSAKKEGDEIVVPEKKEETEAEKEEKKEQAMAADAAAAALPVEEQHPPEGVDAGAAIKADGDEQKKDAAKDGEQFVDPEAMLALEAEKLKQAAGGQQKKKAKRGAINERADGPAAADPAVQNAKEEAALKQKQQPPSVNNPDESDELDNKAPPAIKAGSIAANYAGSRQQRALKNSAFHPARIIINPRCVTTYAGVSHTQLALDLFGNDDDEESLLAVKSSLLRDDEDEDDFINDDDDDDDSYRRGRGAGGANNDVKGDRRGSGRGGSTRGQSANDKYALHEYGPAAETFVCQEMRTSGGRSAPKQQRRTGFSIARGLVEGWQPRRR